MKNASNPYNAMAGFYRTAVAVSALALCFLFFASPAEANYIYDNRTGTWKPTSSTVIAPAGSSSPFNHVPRETSPSVSSTGDFRIKTGGTFGSPPVNGTSRTVPVTVNGTTTKPNVNKALLSRLSKGGLAGIALGVGIDALLNRIDAVIDEAGNVSRTSTIPASGQASYDNAFWSNDSRRSGEPRFFSPHSACAFRFDVYTHHPSLKKVRYAFNNTSPPTCSIWLQKISDPSDVGENKLPVYFHQGTCPSGTTFNGTYCSSSSLEPIPPSDLEDAINSGYNPHSSDYPFLAPDPAMSPTIVEVEPIPRLTLLPTTTTTVDLDTGKTTTVETNIWQDFNIKDNNTTQPKIDATTTTNTVTYVDGSKTNESTTSTSTGVGSQPSSPDGGSSSPSPEMPIDCDLFPTACAWIEWTKEEPVEPDDNVSNLLKEVPISSKTFTISGGAAACPAPLVLNLSQFGSREVSYQPLCDLASTMKYLYLALMSFAAAVLLNRSINRV